MKVTVNGKTGNRFGRGVRLMGRFKYEYDKKGKLVHLRFDMWISMPSRFRDGTSTEDMLYEYDADGNKIHTWHYGMGAAGAISRVTGYKSAAAYIPHSNVFGYKGEWHEYYINGTTVHTIRARRSEKQNPMLGNDYNGMNIHKGERCEYDANGNVLCCYDLSGYKELHE